MFAQPGGYGVSQRCFLELKYQAENPSTLVVKEQVRYVIIFIVFYKFQSGG